MALRQALANVAYTENGALSLATTQPASGPSVHSRTAFFFRTTRNLLQDPLQLEDLLSASHQENVRDTLVLVFHLRNCRQTNGGKGERDLFRACVQWYVKQGLGRLLQDNLDTVVTLGRWDDVLYCPGGHDYLAQQLVKDYRTLVEAPTGADRACRPSHISLAAKWAPSAGMKNKKSKGRDLPVIEALNRHLATTGESVLGRAVLREKEYRQMLSLLRAHLRVVERQMCTDQWEAIDFNQVPSHAMKRYGQLQVNPPSSQRRRVVPAKPGAFVRHCEKRFLEWRGALATGRTTDGRLAEVKASQLFPHEIVGTYTRRSYQSPDDLVEAQWKVLETDLRAKGSLQGCLFVADVSGSMAAKLSPSYSLTCLDVSIALSLLGARCSEGAFRDMVITFSERPTFFSTHHTTLWETVKAMVAMNWGLNTNLQAVFELILQRARAHNVPASEMPRCVVIVSDMEFDACANPTQTNFEALREQYRSSGYTLPTLVFWNVHSSTTQQYPVSADQSGAILLSGYSSSLMKEILDDDLTQLTPWKMIQRILNDPVYAQITV